MEHTLFITKKPNLKYWNKRYTRLYFGNEFCQRLIPPKEDLDYVINFIKKKNIKLSFVTPYVTDKGIERLKLLLDLLNKKLPKTEIIINDYGTLELIREMKLRLKPVLGRLLTKQKRGPRMISIMDKLPKPAIEHFRKSNAGVLAFQKFLIKNGFDRVELDNLLQGISDDFSKSGINASLYYPYAYVTTTRFCLAVICDKKDAAPGIYSCKKECQKYGPFKLTNKHMPVPLLLKGNTQFFENKKLPNDLEKRGINRLVFEPRLPV
ncbi:MAG: hypothetical protein ABIC04_06035 [Nanoarchaeota archaeon]